MPQKQAIKMSFISRERMKAQSTHISLIQVLVDRGMYTMA